MNYADLDQFLADYLPEVKLPGEKTAVGRLLASASAFVDSYCKRPAGYFSPAQLAPSVKRIRGEGAHFLRLPRHVFGTAEIQPAGSLNYYESDVNGWLYIDSPVLNSFEGDETVINSSSYNAYPARFAPGKIYLVSARWGFESTPPDVAEAVRLITNRVWSTQRGTIGQLTPEGFVQDRLIPAAARDLLKPYIRREFER